MPFDQSFSVSVPKCISADVSSIFYKYGAQIRIRSKYAREAELANRALAEKMRAKADSQAASRKASQVELVSARETTTADDHVPGRAIDIDDVEKGLTRPSGGLEGFPVIAAGIGEKLGMAESIKRDESDQGAASGEERKTDGEGMDESNETVLQGVQGMPLDREKWGSAENISLGLPIDRVIRGAHEGTSGSDNEKDISDVRR